jgi:3D (Asp-Asp-Asp) domain-containing protein
MPVVLAPEPVVEVVAEAPEWITFEVTAYTAGPESTGKRPGDEGYGITASGETVRENYTLACPPSMAFGTRLEIEGIGERVCMDRGGAIKEGRLDVYIAELKEARQFGRQRLQVRIIE